MFCSNCGKEIKDGSNFCIHCGVSVNCLVQPKKIVKNASKIEKPKEISKLSKFIRYFFSFIFIIGGLSQWNPFSLLLAIVILPLIKLSKNIRIALGIISFFGIGIWAGIHTTSQNTVNQQEQSFEIKPLYDPKVLDIMPTEYGKGYDKSIKKYGVEGIKKINELLPKAAELMVQNKKCDKLAYVAISDNRSTKDSYTIFGDCENGSRMYISEKEITDKVQPLTKKEKLEAMELSLMNVCDEIIKSKLNYPSTFDKSIFGSGVETDNNKTTVLVGFTAKNAFNLELKYRAICVFNDTPELIDFAMEEER